VVLAAIFVLSSLVFVPLMVREAQVETSCWDQKRNEWRRLLPPCLLLGWCARLVALVFRHHGSDISFRSTPDARKGDTSSGRLRLIDFTPF